jgi:hypothetical protein
MKNPARKVLLVVAALAGALAAAWLGAHLFTADSQLARAIAWMDADIDDYKRFPMRPVANAAPRFDFRQPSADMRARYAPAFAEVAVADGKATAMQPLEAFLERSETVAFLVIKDDVLRIEHGDLRWNRGRNCSWHLPFIGEVDADACIIAPVPEQGVPSPPFPTGSAVGWAHCPRRDHGTS